MWRSERRAAEGVQEGPDGENTPERDLRVAEAEQAPAVVENPVQAHLRAQATLVGGRSTLLRYTDRHHAGIDVTGAHPGGLPQFLTGRSTLLSGLFRDEVALHGARIAAARVATKSVELRTARGLDAVRLAVGFAEWSADGDEFCAPVLLRPTAIRRHHRDFEVRLHGSFRMNPELLRVLAGRFGVRVDPVQLVGLAFDRGVFKPQRVVDRLQELTAGIPGFTVRTRLVISTFADVAARLRRDLLDVDAPLVNALTGDAAARRTLRARGADARPPVDADERPPASDTLLLDADTEQEGVLAQITAGRSLAVHTLPGTGGTQTVINALGALLDDGKRVLVVSPRRSTLDGVRHRLAGIGLPGLAVSPSSLRRDLFRAIGRNEKAQQPSIADVDDALVRLRRVLREYRGALGRTRHDLDVSALGVVRELTRMGEAGPLPPTRTRFDQKTLHRLRRGRDAVGDTMATVARLGEFRFGPDDSPWYGVTFDTTDQAHAAHELAGRLHRTDIPGLLERGYALVAGTRMRPFTTLADLGEALDLLDGIRDSLDVFTPTVFERSLDALIAATGPRREDTEHRGATRRRLRTLAREYLRPGVRVADMHAALIRVRDQRTAWEAVAESVQAVPEVPVGLADVRRIWEGTQTRLAQLDRVLGQDDGHFAGLPVKALIRKLAGLAGDSEYFDNLIERAQLRAELAELGLDELMVELSVRHVPESGVREELEFCWWQSALEHLLRSDRALLGANTSVVDRLERDFRLVDEAHVGASGPLLAARLAANWQIGIVDHAAEADRLRGLLRTGDLTPGQLMRVAPTLTEVLAPAWIASPYEVPAIPDTLHFDVVLLADAGSVSITEAAPALRRADQVVAFGDPVTQQPTPFRIAAGRRHPVDETGPDDEPFDDRSVFEELAEIVPVETLTRSYRAGGEDLAELVNRTFYGGEIVSLPWAGSYLGRGSLSVDYVEGGSGVPDPVTGAVESPDAEVARVVTLVTEHAVTRSGESLMVVTASVRHAERVRAAVDAAFAGRSDVADFVSRDTSEPFAVLTLEESVAESRDRVIFSLGFGLTRHGRVLSDFGDLSGPDGERLLTVGMTRARRSMVIVSCIRPSAFDDGRLEYGAAALMEILGGITGRDRDARLEDLADPLIRALARELRARGVSVDVDYRASLPLVAQYGGRTVVAESDPETAAGSLRESLRLRPQALRRLGWHYVRVHSFDLYSDPGAVATRIAGILGVDPDAPAVDVQTQPLDVD